MPPVLPPEPEGSVPQPYASVVSDAPIHEPDQQVSAVQVGDRRVEYASTAPKSPAAAVAAIGATDPAKAKEVAEAIAKVQGNAPPAGVPVQHILIVAVIVLACFAIFSFKVMFSPEVQFDDSMKSAVMQAWITLGVAAAFFYLGSSAGSKNAGAREASREQ